MESLLSGVFGVLIGLQGLVVYVLWQVWNLKAEMKEIRKHLPKMSPHPGPGVSSKSLVDLYREDLE